MNPEEIVSTLSGHEQRLTNLEKWQEKQNGSLQRIEAKLDRFTWWLVLTLGGVTATLVSILLRGVK